MKKCSFWVLGCLWGTAVWGQGLVITPVADGVYVFTTFQQFKDVAFPANGMYVVGEDGIWIIDAPWDTLQTAPLLDSLAQKHNKRVLGAIATHFHDDRTGSFGVLARKGIPTYATAQTTALCKQRGEQIAQYILPTDTLLVTGRHRLRVRFFGAAHTPDNIFVYDEATAVLFGGCAVKSSEAADLGNLADANPKAWVNTLRAVQKTYPKPLHVIPGHQGWGGGQGLQHTLSLLAKAIK